MRKVYLGIALVFLSLGLSGCLVATIGECIVRDSTNRPCN
jgi:hypothetical protein